ncbi:MAG: hypothetical protein KatS3mg052_2285 [Candidatus Roseilinea sp.]|nr:MAG: hypothetical protein KatS3mg052_2285 [Candidatus Roseilinea sp.]
MSAEDKAASPSRDLADLRRSFSPLPRHSHRFVDSRRVARHLRHPREADRRERARTSTTASQRSWRSPTFARARSMPASTSRCCAPPDAATDPLEHHQRIRQSAWGGRILPTFRPDGVINLDVPDWRANIERLAEASGYRDHPLRRIPRRNRAAPRLLQGDGRRGHRSRSAYAVHRPAEAEREADAIFQRALRGETMPDDAPRFTGHMLMQMARMSVEDGLVMQLHVGARAQPQSRGVRALRAGQRRPIFRWLPNTRATCSRC